MYVFAFSVSAFIDNFSCQDANKIQQYFSSERRPTLCNAIPAIEELQTAWEKKARLPTYKAYHAALEDSIMKLRKYYNRFDDKGTFVMSQGMLLLSVSELASDSHGGEALHPYFKLDYIGLMWEGRHDQEVQRRAGNPNAIDWQDEARKVVENVVCFILQE